MWVFVIGFAIAVIVAITGAIMRRNNEAERSKYKSLGPVEVVSQRRRALKNMIVMILIVVIGPIPLIFIAQTIESKFRFVFLTMIVILVVVSALVAVKHGFKFIILNREHKLRAK